MNFFQRLFSQPKSEQKPEPTQPISEPAPPPPKPTLPPGLQVASCTHVGQIREQNEDSVYEMKSILDHNDGPEPFGLFIVADGMGGHDRGEVASSESIRAAANYILKNIYLPTLGRQDQPGDNRPLNEVLIAAVEYANSHVQEMIPDGGTTFTGALVMGNTAYIAHVGDTRAYLIEPEKIKQVTTDHSLAERLKATGQASEEQLAHIDHLLYKALGQGATAEPDTYSQFIKPGHSLLLCSDGLWKGIDDDDFIQKVVSTAPTLQDACQTLVDKANENGGEDNITAVLISIGASE